MNKYEAMEVLATIHDIYPNFELTERKVSILGAELEKMEYKKVMRKLSAYVIDNPFPPTLGDIAAYPVEESPYLEKMKKWQEEAAKVPEEVKERFRREFKRLLEEKANND